MNATDYQVLATLIENVRVFATRLDKNQAEQVTAKLDDVLSMISAFPGANIAWTRGTYTHGAATNQ